MVSTKRGGGDKTNWQDHAVSPYSAHPVHGCSGGRPVVAAVAGAHAAFLPQRARSGRHQLPAGGRRRARAHGWRHHRARQNHGQTRPAAGERAPERQGRAHARPCPARLPRPEDEGTAYRKHCGARDRADRPAPHPAAHRTGQAGNGLRQRLRGQAGQTVRPLRESRPRRAGRERDAFHLSGCL